MPQNLFPFWEKSCSGQSVRMRLGLSLCALAKIYLILSSWNNYLVPTHWIHWLHRSITEKNLKFVNIIILVVLDCVPQWGHQFSTVLAHHPTQTGIFIKKGFNWSKGQDEKSRQSALPLVHRGYQFQLLEYQWRLLQFMIIK